MKAPRPWQRTDGPGSDSRYGGGQASQGAPASRRLAREACKNEDAGADARRAGAERHAEAMKAGAERHAETMAALEAQTRTLDALIEGQRAQPPASKP